MALAPIYDNYSLMAPKFLDERSGPFSSVAAALAFIPFWRRVAGFEVYILGDGWYVFTDDRLELVRRNASAFISPVSFNVVAGGTVTGELFHVFNANDGLLLQVNESNEGLTVDFIFTGVTNFNVISTHLQYAGGGSHQWTLQLWNFTAETWDNKRDTTGAQTSLTWFNENIFADANYIQSGEVRLRFYHLPSFSPAHYVLFDFVALVSSITGVNAPNVTGDVTITDGVSEINVQEEVTTLVGGEKFFIKVGEVLKSITATAFIAVLEGYFDTIYSKFFPITTGDGTKFFADDGTYKPAGGGSGGGSAPIAPTDYTYYPNGLVKRTLTTYPESKFKDARAEYDANSYLTKSEVQDTLSNQFKRIVFTWNSGQVTSTTVTTITEFSIII